MSRDVAIEMIGSWDKQVGATLHNALVTTMDIIGKNGYEACKQAMILMVHSASKITKEAKKLREVRHDFTAGKDLQFLEIFNQGRAPVRVYKWQFSKKNKKTGIAPAGEWADWRQIRNRGLAKRSWFWGLEKIGLTAPGKGSMRGMSRFYELRGKNNVAGLIKENRLPYIDKTMPAGWLQTVETKAANKMMAIARTKLMSEWRRAVGAGRKDVISNRDLADWFKARAA